MTMTEDERMHWDGTVHAVDCPGCVSAEATTELGGLAPDVARYIEEYDRHRKGVILPPVGPRTQPRAYVGRHLAWPDRRPWWRFWR